MANTEDFDRTTEKQPLSALTKIAEVFVIIGVIWQIFDIPKIAGISNIPALQTGVLAFLDAVLPYLLVLAVTYLAIRLIPQLHGVRGFLGGIIAFHILHEHQIRERSRKDLKSFEDFVSKAKLEIHILAMTGETLRQNPKFFVGLLKKDIRITVILNDPGTEKGDTDAGRVIRKMESSFQASGVRNSILNTLATLENLKNDEGLTNTQKDNQVLMTHEELPLHGMVAVDLKSKNGKMQVELYDYSGDNPKTRMNLLFGRKGDSIQFEQYLRSLMALLKESRPWSSSIF